MVCLKEAKASLAKEPRRTRGTHGEPCDSLRLLGRRRGPARGQVQDLS